MKRYLVLSLFAVSGLALLLSLSVTIIAYAQDAPISEESMEQQTVEIGQSIYRKWVMAILPFMYHRLTDDNI